MASTAEGQPAMRRYLVLALNAKDAAAARDKFLLWQHKAKE